MLTKGPLISKIVGYKWSCCSIKRFPGNLQGLQRREREEEKRKREKRERRGKAKKGENKRRNEKREERTGEVKNLFLCLVHAKVHENRNN